MALLRRDLIDPHCVQPVYAEGVGSLELRNGQIHVTYYVEQEDCLGGKQSVVVARLIYPVSACLPGGILSWAKGHRDDAPSQVSEAMYGAH